MIVVLVTGGRDHPHPDLIHRQLAQVGPDVVVHGDNGRADQAAGAWAREHAVEVKIPYPGRLGRRGGSRRNTLLVETMRGYRELGHECLVMAFPTPRSSGTWDCVRKAEEAGFVVATWRSR